MTTRFSQLAAAGTLTGAEVLALSQPSTTITLVAATLSAAAADNSYNDSGTGFVTAGFAVGQAVRVQGFTGNAANNIHSGVITALTAGKMTIGGTDGDVIVDDAAGESVTITAWVSVRATVNDLGSGSTQGLHAIYIAAGSMSPSVTGGCSTLTGIASAASQPDIRTLDFDTTTQEYAQFGIVMPKSWDEGTVTFKAHWSHAATTVNFGVVFDLAGVAISDDDAIAVAFGTAQTATDTGGTTNDLYSSPTSAAITIAGTPANEDMVFFRLSRVTANGSDTMAIDARLHGVTLYITTNADTDA